MQQLLLNSPMLVTIIFLAVVAWSFPWKGVALWKAARNGHLAWFIILLVFNTLAILEIIYIFAFSKKKEEMPPAPELNGAGNGNPSNLSSQNPNIKRKIV